MKKTFKRKKVLAEKQVEPQVELHVAALIDKMQQQLNSLEGKIDTLISQSSERPSGANRHPKPFRQFDNSRRFGRGSREDSFRERSFTKAICADCKTECEVPFKPTGDRPVYCKDCFAKRKEGGGENRGPGGRNKPSFRHRKHRV